MCDSRNSKVKVCNEYCDIIANKTQIIALKVTCELAMPNNSTPHLEYYGQIVPGNKLGGNIESDKSLVKNVGIQN